MTVIATLRKSLKAAITAVFEDPAVLAAIGGVAPDVLEGKTAKAWFLMNLRGNDGIVLGYENKTLKKRGPLGKRKDKIQFRFTIAICSGDWREPVGATYRAADIAEYLTGSSALPDDTPSLRGLVLANVDDCDIYLHYVSESAEMAPNSTLQGGRFALVQTWETFPEVTM